MEVSYDTFNDNNHIDQVLEVQAEETFEVKLGSNPTTGFWWPEAVRISNAAIIMQENYKFIGP